MSCRFGASLNVSHMDIDADRGLAWVIDMSGQVWFTTGLSADHPDGSGRWWQASYSHSLNKSCEITSSHCTHGSAHNKCFAFIWTNVP